MRKLLFLITVLLTITATAVSTILLILFTGNILIDQRLDVLKSDVTISTAIIINLLLLFTFGIQHSVMARKGVKEKFQKIIPKGLYRMVYILITNVIVVGIIYFWQPIPIVIWHIKTEWLQTIIYAIFFLGWFLMLISPTLINVYELMGIRQLASFFLKKPYKGIPFKAPIVYKLVRHPLYLGFLIAFWTSPLMTVSHFLFSTGMTIYILIGIHYEEKDLVEVYGEEYIAYQKQTPKIIPTRIKS